MRHTQPTAFRLSFWLVALLTALVGFRIGFEHGKAEGILEGGSYASKRVSEEEARECGQRIEELYLEKTR